MNNKYKFCPLCRHPLNRKEVDGRRRLVCRGCGWVYYENPLPVVVCVARDKLNRILVTRRNLNPGINKWALPGGFIELGESPDSACLRELEEETGIKGKVKKLIGVYFQKSMYYGSILIVGYEVIVSGTRLSLNDELKDARFFNKKSLPDIPFSSHRKILEEVYPAYGGSK